MRLTNLLTQVGGAVNHASAEGNRFIPFCRDYGVYVKTVGTCVSSCTRKPQFFSVDASRYLAQLRLEADGVLDREEPRTDALPTYASTEIPVHGVQPVTLWSVIRVIRTAEATEYQPLPILEPEWQRTMPCVVGFDGSRRVPRIHAAGPRGETQLHLAARTGNLALGDLFIRSGIDPGALEL
jgi:hypothetical protein